MANLNKTEIYTLISLVEDLISKTETNIKKYKIIRNIKANKNVIDIENNKLNEYKTLLNKLAAIHKELVAKENRV